MAKKSSTVAPKERINVTYKPETGGAEEEIELPLKVLVIGDFLQRPDARALPDRKPVAVNKNNFGDVMGKQKLSLQFSVPNALQDGESENDIPVELKIKSMRDFEPGNVLKQIPQTQQLLKVREALVSLRGPMGNLPTFRKQIEEIAKNPEMREQLQRELEEVGVDTSILFAKKPGKEKGKSEKEAASK